MPHPIDALWPREGLWRHPDFLRLWSAQAISAWGSRISRTAIPIIAIVSVGATPAQVGILSALSVAPAVPVGLFMGGRVDRARKRPMLIAADLARALLLLSVPLAAWWGALGIHQLYVVAAVMGAATALFQLADNAYLPALIGKKNLVEGNAKLESTDAIAEVAGPSAAGVLIELVTAPMAIAIDAVSYVVSALSLSRIRSAEPAATPQPAELRPFADIATGFRVAWRHPLVRPILVGDALLAASGGFLHALYMIFALDTLGISAGAVGILIGLGGVGAFFGAVLAQRIPRGVGLGVAMIAFAAAGQTTAVFIPLAQGPPWLALACLAIHQLFSDAFMVAYLIHATSLRQTVIPLHSLGRANAAFQVLAGTLLPGAALLAGGLATVLGVRSVVWLGVLVGLLMPAWLLVSPMRSLKHMPSPDDREDYDSSSA